MPCASADLQDGVLQVWADEVRQGLGHALQGRDGAQQIDFIGQQILPLLQSAQQSGH